MLLFRKSATVTAMAVRGFRLYLEAQHTVIKALDGVARRLSSNPILATGVFLHSEAISPSLCHLALPLDRRHVMGIAGQRQTPPAVKRKLSLPNAKPGRLLP